MTVESNCAIAISTLSDWFKNLAPFYQPTRRKTLGKPYPIATCTRDFSRALSKLHGIATNLDWFSVLFAPAVIGRSNYFGTRSIMQLLKREEKTFPKRLFVLF